MRFKDMTIKTDGGEARNSLHSELWDVEEDQLLGKGKRKIQREFGKGPWSTKVTLLITALNMILFVVSVAILSNSNKTRSLSAHEHWRATSYYCTNFQLISTYTRSPVADEENSPSF